MGKTIVPFGSESAVMSTAFLAWSFNLWSTVDFFTAEGSYAPSSTIFTLILQSVNLENYKI